MRLAQGGLASGCCPTRVVSWVVFVFWDGRTYVLFVCCLLQAGPFSPIFLSHCLHCSSSVFCRFRFEERGRCGNGSMCFIEQGRRMDVNAAALKNTASLRVLCILSVCLFFCIRCKNVLLCFMCQSKKKFFRNC